MGYMETKECSMFSWIGVDGHSGATLRNGKHAAKVEDPMQGTRRAEARCVGFKNGS
jgi:hypothetical protein